MAFIHSASYRFLILSVFCFSSLISAAVTPVLNCIEKISDTKYRAWFGYTSTSTSEEVFVIGSTNKITGGGLSGLDQGQLRIFKVGTYSSQFSVIFDGTDLTWILSAGTVVANNVSTLCADSWESSSKQPNYVKTTTYIDDDNPLAVSVEYSDGLGRSIESQIKLPGEADFADAMVTATVYDGAGRASKAMMPVPIKTSGSYVGLTNIEAAAINYYGSTGEGGDAEGYHYSETEYYPDPIGRVSRSGGAGMEYSLDGNPVRYWYFGTKALLTTDFDAIGFLNCTALANLIKSTPVQPAEVTDPTHYLSVTCSPDGSFSQTITDVFGRNTTTWANSSNPPVASSIIISKYEYDMSGNLLKEFPPGADLITGTTYRYNTLSQLIYKNSADGSIGEYVYNDAGLISKSIAKDRNDKVIRTLVYQYDTFNRLVMIGWKTPCGELSSIPLVRYFYDNTDELTTHDYNGIGTFLTRLNNCRGRQVASVSYVYTSNIPICTESEKKYVIDLYSYDDEGRISVKYKIIPGIPVTEINFEYDLQGKVRREKIKSGTVTIVKRHDYDELGRIKKIVHENLTIPKALAVYQYDLKGMLKYRQTSTTNSYTEKYDYNLHGQLVNMKAPGRQLFEENIDYGDLHNGNIDNAQYFYKYGTSSIQNFTLDYTYDGVNRLTNVAVSSGTYPAIAGSGTSTYTYDQAGRLKSKTEGTSVNPTYGYYGTTGMYTSRLNETKGTSTANRLFYDEFGNCIIDKDKKMVMVYDWRNLPIYFRFYSSIPAGIKADSRGTAYVDDAPFTATDRSVYNYMKFKGLKPVSSVSMVYDADGNRVLKSDGK